MNTSAKRTLLTVVGAPALAVLGPLGSAVGISTMLVLVLMHLVVGAVLVVGPARR